MSGWDSESWGGVKNGAGVEVDVCVGDTRGGPVVVCCAGTLVGEVKPGNPAVPWNKINKPHPLH